MSEWSAGQWLLYGLAFAVAWLAVALTVSVAVGPILRRRRKALPLAPSAKGPPQREP